MSTEVEVDETQQAYGDLITATLFIFIITLVAYIINFSANQEQVHSIGQKISDIVARQTYLVRRVSHYLTLQGVEHTSHPKEGVIRFTADSLTFESGTHKLSEVQQQKMKTIARVMAGIVPCYAENPSRELVSALHCTQGQRGQLKGIVIEGNTDNLPFRSRPGIQDNLDLSAKRAGTVERSMLNNPILGALRNSEHQVLFSIAGYGDTHPLNVFRTPTADSDNRRIDIRFVLNTPWAFGGYK